MNDEERLLAGAQRGDQVILGEVYDKYSTEIYRYAWQLLGKEDLAEECVADSFSRFLKVIKNGNGPRNHLRAYLYRIAHNWIRDYWSDGKNNTVLIEPDTQASKETNFEDGIADQQDIMVVRQALKQLTSDQQAVIVLKYLEELENLQIAKILNKPVGAIKSLQHRGLNSLRRLLSAHYHLENSDKPRRSAPKTSFVMQEGIYEE